MQPRARPTGSWEGGRESVCPGCGGGQKASLTQAGEQLKDTAKRVTAGLKRWT